MAGLSIKYVPFGPGRNGDRFTLLRVWGTMEVLFPRGLYWIAIVSAALPLSNLKGMSVVGTLRRSNELGTCRHPPTVCTRAGNCSLYSGHPRATVPHCHSEQESKRDERLAHDCDDAIFRQDLWACLHCDPASVWPQCC